MTMTTSKFRVAVVGGGIGGLSFLIALAKCAADSIDVDLYESTKEFTEVGAGIGVWPRVWEILQLLGLEDDLKAVSGRGDQGPAPTTFRKSDQSEGYTFYETTEAVAFHFHRAHFQAVLLKHLPETFNVHFSKRLVSYTSSSTDPITLQFSDNTTAQCDMLIGADGLKSAVRSSMYTTIAEQLELRGDQPAAAKARSHISPRFSGHTVYRSLVPKEAIEAIIPGHHALANIHIYAGKNKHIVAYPVSQSLFVNLVVIVCDKAQEDAPYDGPWVTEVSKEELAGGFSLWEPEVKCLVECVTKASRWAVHAVRDLPSFVSETAVLLGDAAHAMTPHLASGAGQAIEDGYILATILAHPRTTLQTLPEALRIYDLIRRPLAQQVQEKSQGMGYLFNLNTPEFADVTIESSAGGAVVTMDRLDNLVKTWQGQVRWAWDSSIVKDHERALELLEGLPVQGTV